MKTQFDHEKALTNFTELSRLISVGAYDERDIDGSYGEDGIEELADNLIFLAQQNGFNFIWHEDHYWTLEPMLAEEKAAFEKEQGTQ